MADQGSPPFKSDMFDVQRRDVLPRRYRGAPRRPVGAPGLRTAPGDSPAASSPAPETRGAIAPTFLPPRPMPPVHPRYGISTAAPAVPKSAYAPAGMYRGRCTPCSPGAPPGYTTPPAIGMTSPAAARRPRGAGS